MKPTLHPLKTTHSAHRRDRLAGFYQVSTEHVLSIFNFFRAAKVTWRAVSRGFPFPHAPTPSIARARAGHFEVFGCV
jgi:hypothetical protein